MKTVAIVGMSPATRDLVQHSHANEIWTCNHSYAYVHFPGGRIDRLFEMHPWFDWLPRYLHKWELWNKLEMKAHKEFPFAGDIAHFYNLQQWQAKFPNCPIYMLEARKEIPGSVRYPIENISQHIFGKRMKIGKVEVDCFKSSFDYMMGMAIYEKFDVIEIYGFEMRWNEEYRHQKPSAVGWIRDAIARGITVQTPEGCKLIPHGRYMYDGGTSEVVQRSTLEHELREQQSHLKAEQDHDKRLTIQGRIEMLQIILDELDLEET